VNELAPAVAFSPGDYIKEALEGRGWTQDEFAEIIGRSPNFVTQLVNGEKAITPRAAKELAAAFGTSAILWLNLEAAYRLHHSQDPVPARINRQARLREKFAVREMVKRGWIEASTDPDVLEGQVLRFFDIPSIDATPTLAHAAKKVDYPEELSGPQLAWLFRVRQIAMAMPMRPYSERALREAIPRLRELLDSPADIRLVPKILADCGVRFVIVEHVPSSKIDGVCLWLKGKINGPVIGMSLRLDRIDNFWFVLRHEIEHVLRRHGQAKAIVDSEVIPININATPTSMTIAEEQQANDASRNFCVPEEEMADFIHRHNPIFSEEKLEGFARRIRVHPGLVVGQLQRWSGDYRLFRKYLIGVRSIVAPVSMSDGYGQVIPLAS
jgi:HTH-type transcriptional regulator/antitoxin HigA